MGRKKSYTCIVCGKTYEGYRRARTCGNECSMVRMKKSIRLIREFWRTFAGQQLRFRIKRAIEEFLARHD